MPLVRQTPSRFETWAYLVCAAALGATLLVGSSWPLVGDSILMHYVVWLTHHGFAPYRDIAEMNLPLTYMSEQLAMWLFGAGSGAWRIYDGALTIVVVLLFARLLRERGMVAGVFAATLFAAVHLQDGVGMAGQRDLLVTVFELIAGVALLRPANRTRPAVLWPAIAGACGVAAACIKPPALLFIFAAATWRMLSWEGAPHRATRLRWLAGCALGALAPLLVCWVYLLHFRAVPAFLQDLHGLIAYHASLERRSVGFLLGHTWSPVLPFLVPAVLAIVWTRHMRWTPAEHLSGIGAAAGFTSYLVQGKGFPYQRYPFLAWLLLLCVSRLTAALQASSQPASRLRNANHGAALPRALAAVALLCAAVLIVVFLTRASRFSHADPYAPLRADLIAQHAEASDGRVQCLDTAGPCIGALYEERLTQSTGFLYDCYLLDGNNPVVQQQRTLFEREWQARPPALIILTDSNCFTGPRTFAKYSSWPWMQQQLASYKVLLERHPTTPLHLWSRPEQPYAYRILQRAK